MTEEMKAQAGFGGDLDTKEKTQTQSSSVMSVDEFFNTDVDLELTELVNPQELTYRIYFHNEELPLKSTTLIKPLLRQLGKNDFLIVNNLGKNIHAQAWQSEESFDGRTFYVETAYRQEGNGSYNTHIVGSNQEEMLTLAETYQVMRYYILTHSIPDGMHGGQLTAWG